MFSQKLCKEPKTMTAECFFFNPTNICDLAERRLFSQATFWLVSSVG